MSVEIGTCGSQVNFKFLAETTLWPDDTTPWSNTVMR